MLKKLLGFLGFILISTSSLTQNLTNEGVEFYIAFPEMFDNSNATFEINISSRVTATGTVEITGTGFSKAFSVVPGVVSTVTLIGADADIIINEMVIERAIHVTASSAVTVYASTFHSARSEASICLPITAFSSNYMVTTYPTMKKGNIWYQSEFIVVAGSKACDVTIVPASTTESGAPAGVPISVHLEPNEVYQVQAQTGGGFDLTGSTISADNGKDKFAVYNGHIWTYLTNCGNQNADPLFEQAYPLESWGSDYILMITKEQDDNAFRVVAKENGTTFRVDGVLTGPVLNTGDVYDGNFSDIDEAIFIESNKPCAVTQTMTTGVCSGNGDPSMIVLNSNEQMYLDTVTFYAATGGSSLVNYVNVVTRSSDTTKMKFNGNSISYWTQLTYDNSYSYKLFPTGVGSHTISTTGCGFLAYAYGMGNPESYFYAAGARVNSINDSISFTNINTISENACHLDSILFTPIISGGNVLKYTWSFGDGGFSSEAQPIHIYTKAGTYQVKLIVEYLCFTDTISEDISVFDSPILNPSTTDVSCYNWNDGMIETNVASGTPAYNYLWSSGHITKDIVNLSKGDYTVIVVDQNGCKDSATIKVDEPSAIAVIVNPAGPFNPAEGTRKLVSVPTGGVWSADCGACIDPVSGVFSPLVAGEGIWKICYTVTKGGCDTSKCINILVDEDCAMVINTNDASCFGYEDGSLVVSYSGGVGTPSIIISDNKLNQVNPTNANVGNNLTEGWYRVEYSDLVCSFDTMVYIGEPDKMVFSYDLTTPLCYGFLTGAAVVDTVFNYTGSYDSISYYWDPAPIEADGLMKTGISGVAAGEYAVEVYDENGCHQLDSFIIHQPDSIATELFGYYPTLCRLYGYQYPTGRTFISASGGTGNLYYNWLNVYTLETSRAPTWPGLNTGLYKITISDDNNCELERFIRVDSVNPIANFTPTSDDFHGPGEFEGTEVLRVKFSNESINFTDPNSQDRDTIFSWSFNANDQDSAIWEFQYDLENIRKEFIGERDYQVCLVARNKNDCRDTSCRVIKVHYFPKLDVPNVFTPGVEPNNEFFFPNVAISDFTATVFDRYGIEVFKFEDINDRWNGNYKGKPCTDGVYFFTYIALSSNGTPFSGQGNLHLLRHR